MLAIMSWFVGILGASALLISAAAAVFDGRY